MGTEKQANCVCKSLLANLGNSEKKIMEGPWLDPHWNSDSDPMAFQGQAALVLRGNCFLFACLLFSSVAKAGFELVILLPQPPKC